MNSESSFIGSFLEKLGSLMPNAIVALVFLVLGFFAAALIRKSIELCLGKIKLDERINKDREEKFQVESLIATFIYYLTLLYFLVVILSFLGVESALAPLQNMYDQFIGYSLNIIAAGVIGFAGYIIARIASGVVGALAGGVDALSDKIGLGKTINLSKLIQQLVFIFIFVPILIAALDTLKITAISDPATEMIKEFVNAIPVIIYAAITFAVFFIAGKFVVSMLVELLKNLKADELPKKLGLEAIFGKGFSLSKMAGKILFFFIMFMAVINASEILSMIKVTTVLRELLELAGKILLGITILVVGNFFSNLAYKVLHKGEQTKALASVARYAILALVLAIGLNAMGLADTIVHLAFGLSLGAIAVAFALSFGLGGREAAGKHMEYLLEKFRSESKK